MAQILTKVNNLRDIDLVDNNNTIDNSKIETLLSETSKVTIDAYKPLIANYSSPKYNDILIRSMYNKQYFERAFFVRLGYEFFKPDWTSIANALASVELRYTSLVVTDDIFDNNDIRMGKDSIPKEVGVNNAVSLAAILKSLSSIALTESIKKATPSLEVINRILIADEKSHLDVYEGQLADIETEAFSIGELNEDFYLDMIRKTTGEDVGYCLELGALLAGCTNKEADYLKSAGIALGTIMQLRDDMIDYINSEEIINKIPFRDFEENKLRLPIILAYKFANDKEKKTIEELIKKNILTKDERDTISKLVLKEEVTIYATNIMSKMKDSILVNLERLNNTKQQDIMKQLIFNVVVL